MTDTLISFPTAKLAKEKGFIEPCMHKFTKKGFPLFCTTQREGDSRCPTQSLLQKWLREKHNIIVLIAINEEFGYVWKIINRKKGGFKKTYEEALEAGLYEALKLIP